MGGTEAGTPSKANEGSEGCTVVHSAPRGIKTLLIKSLLFLPTPARATSHSHPPSHPHQLSETFLV